MLKRRGFACGAAVLITGFGLLMSGCAADSDNSVARDAGAAESGNYVGADLVGHDFRGQNLSGADFRGANLKDADFTDANLSGTNFAHLPCSLPMNAACSADWGVGVFAAPEAVDQVLGKAGATGLTNGSKPNDVRFNQPEAVAVSPDSSSVYVADVGNRVVRRIDLHSGAVSTFAGSGEKYDTSSGAEANGAGESANHLRLTEPAGLAVAPDGRVFIADAKANVIWAVEPDGSSVAWIAGTGKAGTPKQSADLPLNETRFANPHGLAFNKDGTELYVADTGNNAVRVINFDADSTTTIAGSEEGLQCTWLVTSSCGTTGKAEYALLRAPEAVAVAADGRVAIADTGDDAVRLVDTKGKISTLVAPPKSTPQSAADSFPKPRAVAFTAAGDLFTGPTKASGGLARIDKAETGTTQNWNALAAVNTSGSNNIGGVAVNPTSRWAVVTDTGSHEVKLVVPQVGANVVDATFTGANLGIAAGNKQTVIDGWTGQTPLTNVDLSNAIIRDSDLSDTRDSTLEAARISGGHLADMSNVNMYAATISDGTNVSGDNLCMTYTYIRPGIYPNWNLTDSTLAHQWQAPSSQFESPGPAAVFVEPEFSNVDMAQASTQSRLVFDGGNLEDVNFSPNDARDHQEIKFKGTSLGNTPRNTLTAEQDRPDYTKTPKNWNPSTTNKACAQKAPTAAGTYYSPVIHWGDKDAQGRYPQNAEFALVINPNGILSRIGVDDWRNNDKNSPWGCNRNKQSTQCWYEITRIRQTDTGESRTSLYNSQMIVDNGSEGGKPTRWWDLDDHYAVAMDTKDSSSLNPSDLNARVLPGDKFEITTPFGSATGEFSSASQTPPAPDTPPAPKVTINQAGSATLSWDKPVHGGRNGAIVFQFPSIAPVVTDTAFRQITYTVQKSSTADGAYTDAGTCAPAQVLDGRCEIGGLGNESVFLRVQASNSGGSSSYSEPVLIDTKVSWVNQATQKCINSENDLKLRDCNADSPTQQFSFDAGKGAMVAAADGRCWDTALIWPNAYVSYPGVVLANCNGSDAQKWEIRNGTFWNRSKNQCLTDLNLSIAFADCDEKSTMQQFALARSSK